ANCRGVPLVSNVATEDELATVGPWVFHAVPSRRAAARASAELAAVGRHQLHAAVLYPEEGDGRALALAFGERFAALGAQVVLSEPYAASTTDFTPLARRVLDAHPDVLYVPADADALLMLVPALAFHEVAIAVIGSEEMGSDRVLHTVGTNLEGAVLPAPE